MKNLLKLTLVVASLFVGTLSYAQGGLPPKYEPILNEIVENFKEIRGTKSLDDGKNSLRILSDDKIIIRMMHNKSVKTLTFETTPDEEGNKYWQATNKLTSDMVNKYEKETTKALESMLSKSRKKAKI